MTAIVSFQELARYVRLPRLPDDATGAQVTDQIPKQVRLG